MYYIRVDSVTNKHAGYRHTPILSLQTKSRSETTFHSISTNRNRSPPASVPPDSAVASHESPQLVTAQSAHSPHAMKRERVSERLSESQVFQLVKIYKEYDCLWDISHANYKNREVRDHAYREILERLNIPGLKVAHIPQKIKNLRSSYYTELRKMENSAKGGVKPYKPKVAWFSIADEMLKTKNQLVWSQNVESTETESEESSDVKTKKDDTEQITTTLDKRTKNVTVSLTTSRQSNEPETKKKNYEEDQFDVYGKYIAMSLRSMPEEMSIIARMELQKTMAKMQLKALRQEKRATNTEQYGPSTSKMEEILLEDPPDDIVEMEDNVYPSTVKIEVEEEH